MPPSAKRCAVLAIGGLTLALLWQHLENRRTVGALRTKIQALEANVTTMNDQCETRIAVLKADLAEQLALAESMDGRTFAEFLSSMPPDFAEHLSAELAGIFRAGICGRLEETAVERKKRRTAVRKSAPAPDDRPAKPPPQ